MEVHYSPSVHVKIAYLIPVGAAVWSIRLFSTMFGSDLTHRFAAQLHPPAFFPPDTLTCAAPDSLRTGSRLHWNSLLQTWLRPSSGCRHGPLHLSPLCLGPVALATRSHRPLRPPGRPPGLPPCSFGHRLSPPGHRLSPLESPLQRGPYHRPPSHSLQCPSAASVSCQRWSLRRQTEDSLQERAEEESVTESHEEGQRSKNKVVLGRTRRGEKRSTESIMTAQRIYCLISLKARRKKTKWNSQFAFRLCLCV